MTEETRIKDIHSFKKINQEIENFKALKQAIPASEPLLGQLGINIDQIYKALPKMKSLKEGGHPKTINLNTVCI